MRNRNPVFTMPTEQTPAAPVEGMILVDAERYRHVHKQLEDTLMKISELSGKVDALISIATNYKNASTSATASNIPSDDPEIEALGNRIDDAIAVLQGTKTVDQQVPAATSVDPNAPVT
jgi:hypothetical protein